MKIYTRTGDAGETALFDGTRVRKSDPPVDAYGHVDELNAVLGLARAACLDATIAGWLDRIQRDLFASARSSPIRRARIAGARHQSGVSADADVTRLEQWIDAADAELPPLRRFILPGGAPCRRDTASGAYRLPPRRAPHRRRSAPTRSSRSLIAYVNRLSDLLFVLARLANARAGVADRGVVSDARPTRTRPASGSRATHYENFPGRLAAAAAPHAPARGGRLRLRALADDFADEGGPVGARALRAPRRLAGPAACRRWPRAGSHRGRAGRRGHAVADVFEALAHTDPLVRAAAATVRGPAERVPAGRDGDAGTRRGRTCSTTAGDRRTRSAASCFGSQATATARSTHASDALCTALQLTNFWQDLAIDWERGPTVRAEAERVAAGAREEDLDRGRITSEWRTALARAAGRTRALFREGRPVCDGVHGRLRYELRATWLGASRVLDRLEAGGFDVFAARPALGAPDAAALALGVVTWRKSPRLQLVASDAPRGF